MAIASEKAYYQMRQRPFQTHRGGIDLVLSTPAQGWGKAAQTTPRDTGRVLEIAWKAQNRLHKRYRKLTMAGKDLRKVTTAVARELLGFRAITIKIEQTTPHHNWQRDKRQNIPEKKKQKP